MEKNILLTIQYDGTGFHGWQRQPGRATIQGDLEAALSSICCEEIKIDGTSRTDAGVHAYGQQASFQCDLKIPIDKLAFAVNNRLTAGGKGRYATGPIRILKAEEKPKDFHARFDAKGKQYLYKILNTEQPDIFSRNFYCQIKKTLDIAAMQRAAGHIVGTHDFACFQGSGGQERETTVRRIFSLEVYLRGTEIIFDVRGDGFLYHMVRIVAGTLIEVGSGVRAADSIKQVIDSRNRSKAGYTAPPQGLYLAQVYYGNVEDEINVKQT